GNLGLQAGVIVYSMSETSTLFASLTRGPILRKKQILKLTRRHRPSQQKALGFLAATALQKTQLLLGLHAFRNDVQPKALAQVQQRPHERRILRGVIDAAHKGPIYLQAGNRVLFEQAQRGKAGAIVIEG